MKCTWNSLPWDLQLLCINLCLRQSPSLIVSWTEWVYWYWGYRDFLTWWGRATWGFSDSDRETLQMLFKMRPCLFSDLFDDPCLPFRKNRWT